MKTLKQFLMVTAFVVLASGAVFAQKQDDKKPKNPKDNPPQIVVPKDGKNRPKDGDKPRNNPKKPQGEFLGLIRTEETFD